METTWILLGLVGWALGLLFVLMLLWMARARDRAAGRGQKNVYPLSEVTIPKVDEPPKSR